MTNTELWYTEEYSDHIRFSYRVTGLLYRKKTKYQLLEVLETPEFGRLMLLDGKVMITQRDEHIYHEMITHPAILLHPQPKNILVVGGGDGGSVRELIKHKQVERIYLVEIDEDVLDICKEYFPELTASLSDSRVDVIVQDAAEYISETSERFDIILIDSTDPVGPGPVGPADVLITDDFFDRVKEILTEDGIVVAQTGSPVYHIEYLKSYNKKLSKRYSYVATYLLMVPSYAGLWSLTWAAKTIDPSSEPVRQPPDGLKYYRPELFRAALEMGRLQFWDPPEKAD
ncbi:polyamine aminopropyltransferase [candidate division WOR-3 bacterium]|nr:polyamine aminopropyltransferase [candidate division WOR-3 bacterium]